VLAGCFDWDWARYNRLAVPALNLTPLVYKGLDSELANSRQVVVAFVIVLKAHIMLSKVDLHNIGLCLFP
jgi:hypothetical protein